MKSFKQKHLLGIASIICLFIGAIGALAFMYFQGNKMVIIQKDDTPYRKQTFAKKDSLHNKRYLIINNYYQKSPNNKCSTKQYTDTIVSDTTKTDYVLYKPKSNNIVLDINTADSLDFQMLRGIGPTFSRRICRYREKLGGFVNLNQLREVYGMSDTLYNMIVTHLEINDFEPKKININSINIKQLAKHPYIDYYLAKSIVEFHNAHGEFKNIEDLKQVYLMDEKTYNKLKPYVDLQ